MHRKNQVIAGIVIGIAILLFLQFNRPITRQNEADFPRSLPETSSSIAVATSFTRVPPQPVIATNPPTPTTTSTRTPSPTATSTIPPTFTSTPTPAADTLAVTLDKICIHKTGDIPLSRADLYFSVRVIDSNGVSHTIREVLQPQMVKHAASLNCADPLRLGDQKIIMLRQIEGSCLRIEGEFWNANRLWDDTLVGKIDEPICFRRGNWSPIGEIARHLIGGGADWEVFLNIEVVNS